MHKTAQRIKKAKPVGYLSGEVTPVLKFEIYSNWMEVQRNSTRMTALLILPTAHKLLILLLRVVVLLKTRCVCWFHRASICFNSFNNV